MAILGAPNLRPWSPTLRRLLVAAAVLLAVVATAVVDARRQPASELLLSGPDHSGEYLRTALREIGNARERIWICMYVIRLPDRSGDHSPVDALLVALSAAVERGVHVQVVLDQGKGDERDDGKHVTPAAELRTRGVRVVLDEGTRTTHAKFILIDQAVALVGSHNWTRSALTTNREATLLTRDPDTCRDLARFLAAVPGWDNAH